MSQHLADRQQARPLPEQLTGQRVSHAVRSEPRDASGQAGPLHDVVDEVGADRFTRSAWSPARSAKERPSRSPAALAGLDPSRTTTIYLGIPAVGARGLYAEIVTALGALPRFHKAALIPQITELLAAETAERGRAVVLVLDEAHLLSVEVLEELRLLTNADMDSRSPFACLLVGQPTLRRRIKLGTFAALDQRIALRYAMSGMIAAETKTYLSHHLQLAGRSDTLFSDDAIALVHQVSRGLPRAVNNLAAPSPDRRLRVRGRWPGVSCPRRRGRE
jgi:hypothetical protein